MFSQKFTTTSLLQIHPLLSSVCTIYENCISRYSETSWLWIVVSGEAWALHRLYVCTDLCLWIHLAPFALEFTRNMRITIIIIQPYIHICILVYTFITYRWNKLVNRRKEKISIHKVYNKYILHNIQNYIHPEKTWTRENIPVVFLHSSNTW